MSYNNAIVLIYPDHSTQIKVRVENDTVWLNRNQLASLFDRDVKTIGKHISNILKEELKGIAVVAKFATTAIDGKTYQIEYYNLDVIISIGYRVKSRRGVQFRIWANKVLKDHLIKGYSFSNRIDRLEDRLCGITTRLDEIEVHINANISPKQGVFFQGQVFDAYSFTANLIREARESIILIDNYVDDSVLTLLTKRQKNVSATIFTKNINKQLQLDLKKYNSQYPHIKVFEFEDAHDRFLVLDEKELYHFGASLKDLGKKWFAFSKIDNMAELVLEKLYKSKK
jgi:hypothetical protein